MISLEEKEHKRGKKSITLTSSSSKSKNVEESDNDETNQFCSSDDKVSLLEVQ